MGWWIALAVLMGLAILPLGVSARYNADGFRLAVTAGPLRFRILPEKKKEEKPKKDKKEKPARKRPEKKKDAPKAAAPKTEVPPAQKPGPAAPPDVPLEKKYPNLNRKPRRIPRVPTGPQTEEGGSWKDFLALVPIGLDFLGECRRKLRVKRLEMKLILAGGDPCDLAINYGKAWAAVGVLMNQLERLLVIRKRDVEVECDFVDSETKVIARLDITMTLGRMIVILCKYGFRALAEYLKIMKKRKGGAAK